MCRVYVCRFRVCIGLSGLVVGVVLGSEWDYRFVLKFEV